MTLALPVQARCDNRSQVTRSPVGGSPDDWWRRPWLEERGYTRATFDYFVDWSSRSLQPVAWSKVLATGPSAAAVRAEDQSLVPRAIGLIDDVTNRAAIASVNLDHSIRVLPDPFRPADAIGAVDARSGTLVRVPLQDLEDEIERLSGGRFQIGAKGLTYGTSDVECHLSRTDTPWPGDVDAVIFEAESLRPVCVLEWKKHNPQYAGRIEDHLFERYYPGRDQRKWDRLAILARALEVPLGVVYFSSQADTACVIDRLTGPDQKLQVASRDTAAHPGQEGGSGEQLWARTLNVVAPVTNLGLAAESRASYDT